MSEDIEKENENWTKLLVNIRGDQLSQENDEYRRLVNETGFLQLVVEGKRVIERINAQMEKQDHMDSDEWSRAGRRQPEVYPTRPKLPEIKLPKFDGNLMKWLNFWDHFHTVIRDNPSIPVIDKFQYHFWKVKPKWLSNAYQDVKTCI